jgi:RNA polymerase sigma factor for flagellar operon FliA
MNRATKYTDEDNNNFIVVIEEFSPLVKKIALHLLSRLPSNIQLDDLLQAGMIGLIEAAKNYNADKGASLSTFASIRIRGAMLDEIRRGDWAPRSVHKNTRMISEAIRKIENNTGRNAKDEEIAHVLNISLTEYHAIIRDTSTRKIFSFEDIGLTPEMMSVNGSVTLKGPLEGIQRDDVKKKIGAEISKLPEREKLILSLYYDEELNLREVGEVLGVSESRISQLHSQAMVRLQSKLSDLKSK